MAPEVWKKSNGLEVDIWSAKVIMYTLLCGWYLFGQQHNRGLDKQLYMAI
jgi:hypothetical protein